MNMRAKLAKKAPQASLESQGRRLRLVLAEADSALLILCMRTPLYHQVSITRLPQDL